MKTAYVTGVAGFLGSHVARALMASGYHVYGCDDFSVGAPENVPTGVRFREKKCEALTDTDFLLIESVVHCAAIARSAWPNEDQLWSANVAGTAKVMAAADRAGVRDIVHASSSVVHHPTSSTYARTKTAAERIALGFGAICLRFGNIYGLGQNETGSEPNVIAQMRRSVRERGTVRVDGDGTQSRDFVHVLDAANAVVSAIEEPVRGMWLDICSGQQTTILEIAEMFDVPIEWAEGRNDPHSIVQDPEPARWLLHWAPGVDLQRGLTEAVKS